MNLSGWIMFLVSWVFFISLIIFCYYRIFTARHLHAPVEIDTEAD